MLLMIEALLLISAAVVQDHRAAAVYTLDMAENSVDDEYCGCIDEMRKLVKDKYLEEINHSPKFKTSWKEGGEKYKTAEDTLTIDHLIAIYVYTDFESEVYGNLNTADRSGKTGYKEKKYKWYSLHFLLTEAIQHLKKIQNKKHTTYRGTKMDFNKVDVGTEIRFGSFTSSSTDPKVAQKFGSKSCFEIETAEGADVMKYSKHPDQKEVLIPPYEIFKVTAVKTKTHDKDLWCETVFILETSGRRSNLNCAVAHEAKL